MEIDVDKIKKEITKDAFDKIYNYGYKKGYKDALIEKAKPIILDDNPLSLAGYAKEFPENWEKIEKAIEEGKTLKIGKIDNDPNRENHETKGCGEVYHEDLIHKDGTKDKMVLTCGEDNSFCDKCDPKSELSEHKEKKQ